MLPLVADVDRHAPLMMAQICFAAGNPRWHRRRQGVKSRKIVTGDRSRCKLNGLAPSKAPLDYDRRSYWAFPHHRPLTARHAVPFRRRLAFADAVRQLRERGIIFSLRLRRELRGDSGDGRR